MAKNELYPEYRLTPPVQPAIRVVQRVERFNKDKLRAMRHRTGESRRGLESVEAF